MILDAYYDAVRRLLGHGDTDAQITHVGFGTDGTPADPADTALSEGAILVPLGTVETPAGEPRTLRVHFLLPRNTGNGMEIREIGLFTADGTLVARKTREAINKTADMEIGDTWEIQV